MPTSTLTPAAPRPAARGRSTARTLVVVADVADTGAEHPAPGWVERWCRRAGWTLAPHPETGPGAAAAAARHDTRVLVLRPGAPGNPRPGTAHAGGPARSPLVVAAIRSLPDDASVVADAAAGAALLGGRLTIVHAVPRSFAERSVGLDGAVAHGRRLLDAAASRAVAHAPGLVVDCELLRVRPHELVNDGLHADLLVVGGPRAEHHAGARPSGRGPGLVAHSALHHAPCPVLLTPR